MKTLLLITAVGFMVVSAFAQQKGTTISKEQATQTALKQFPGGTVKDAELETENGRQVWSLDIELDKQLHEVWVDAQTGEIVKTGKESAAVEGSEKGMERAEKIALKEIPGEVIKSGTATVHKQPVFQFVIKSKRGQNMVVDVNKKTYKVVRVTPQALESAPKDTVKK